jgi:hypothetical protein
MTDQFKHHFWSNAAAYAIVLQYMRAVLTRLGRDDPLPALRDTSELVATGRVRFDEMLRGCQAGGDSSGRGAPPSRGRRAQSDWSAPTWSSTDEPAWKRQRSSSSSMRWTEDKYPTWQHQGGKKMRWTNHDDDSVEQLELAYMFGMQRIPLTIGGWSYEVDLTQLQQVSTHTGATRSVRRLTEPSKNE